MNFNKTERACIGKLAEMFEAGCTVTGLSDAALTHFGLTKENAIPILTMLAEAGIIVNPVHTADGPFAMFTITAKAVMEAREQAAPKDIVEEVKMTFRRHPVAAWGIVISVAVIGLATGINQILELLKKLGWIE